MCIWINFSIFVPLKPYTMEENKDLNRIKVMLAEKKRTNKWLAEQPELVRIKRIHGEEE